MAHSIHSDIINGTEHVNGLGSSRVGSKSSENPLETALKSIIAAEIARLKAKYKDYDGPSYASQWTTLSSTLLDKLNQYCSTNNITPPFTAAQKTALSNLASTAGSTAVSGWATHWTSPHDEQKAINKYISEHTGKGKHMSPYELMCLMGMMMAYGNDVVGLQANQQKKMNSFYSQLHDAWNILNCADCPDTKIKVDGHWELKGKVLYQKFKQKLLDLEHNMGLPGSPFDSTQGKAMIKQVKDAVNNILSHAGALGVNDLCKLWAATEPSGSGTGKKQGSSAGMQPVTSGLGQLNQIFTGESSVMATRTKADVKKLQASTNSFNNFMKSVHNLLKVMTNNQQTR